MPSERSRAEIIADIRGKLAEIPGVGVGVGQPISHRIDHILSGVQAQIAIKIFGDDLDVLRTKGEELRGILAGVKGIADAQVERMTLIPQVHIRVDRQKAAQYGLRPGEVAHYAELAMYGSTVTQILEGSRLHDVVVRLTDEARGDLESIRRIPVDTAGGQIVPLGQIARVEEAKGPNMINRDNGQRRIVVSANAAGRDLVSVVEEARTAIQEKLALPEGYYVSYEGQFESQAEATRLIGLLSIVSLISMGMVLYAHLRSVPFTIMVMPNIPLAFVGAVIGIMWQAGNVLSIATMGGFIALTGIAARNGIMMISHYLHLMEHEGEKFTQAMVIRGTQERIIPALMTAITAALALIPLLLGAGEPGREILHPVAVVIFFGLFSSTLLDLIVTPLVFWQFGHRSIAKLLPQAVEPAP